LSDSTGISVIVPAHKRFDTLSRSLAAIQACVPPPDEVIVHVDGSSEYLIQKLRDSFPTVKVLKSDKLLGPGGSRTVMVEAAANEWVANFDEDSHPETPDYFYRIVQLITRFPDVAMFSAASNDLEKRETMIQRVAIPSGCGCVFRKSWMQRTGGFVPLPIAYGMEEVDMGLRLHAEGGQVLMDPLLRVVHDKQPPETINEELNAGVFRNTVLFPYLRFPIWLWPLGAWAAGRRLLSCLIKGWTQGLASAISTTPEYLSKHAAYRKTVPGAKVLAWFWTRWKPVLVIRARDL
jgi:GT2 family glycosyltransferase